VIDAWWIRTFGRPLEELDAADWPRLMRAMEADRIWRAKGVIEGWKAGKVTNEQMDRAVPDALFEELMDGLANARHHHQGAE
jgi:hypothetical protein